MELEEGKLYLLKQEELVKYICFLKIDNKQLQDKLNKIKEVCENNMFGEEINELKILEIIEEKE